MRKRMQKVLALWVGCGLLGGCTALDMEAPGGDMKVEDSSPGEMDATGPPRSDLTVSQPDLVGVVVDMTQPTTDGGLTLLGGFVGGAVVGAPGGQGGYQLRGQFLWHGSISGAGGGYTLSGWLL